MAARGTRAAAHDAGDRIRQCRIAADAPLALRSVGPQRSGLRRGAERNDGVSLGGWSIRAAFGAHGRPRASSAGRDCSPPATLLRLPRKAATTTIPIVFGSRRRPGQARPRRQPQPAGRQRDRYQFFRTELGAKRLALLHELVPEGACALPCWSIRQYPSTESIRDIPEAAPCHRECKLRSSTPAPAARSRRPSRTLVQRSGRRALHRWLMSSSRAGAYNCDARGRHRIPANYAFARLSKPAA